MTVVKCKPTSAGRRHVVKVTTPDLYKGAPYKALLEAKRKTGGRNNTGRITTRHIGGGHKQFYRLVDFKRNILAPKGLTVGSTVVSGSEAPIKVGNTLPMRNIPVGTTVHAVELFPGKGAQLARSAGAYAQILARDGSYVTLRLRSGEMRRVLADGRATIGEVGNSEHMLRQLGKAGAKRWLGIRPTVRGMSMNPIDHPHGGGEGRNKGIQPVTPWGQPCKGYKTRHNKRTDKYIVHRRSK